MFDTVVKAKKDAIELRIEKIEAKIKEIENRQKGIVMLLGKFKKLIKGQNG